MTYKYECPPCPRGARCEMCQPPHITLADLPNEKLPEKTIRVDFEINELNISSLFSAYESIRMGKPVILNVTYGSEGFVRNSNDYFSFNSLLS